MSGSRKRAKGEKGGRKRAKGEKGGEGRSQHDTHADATHPHHHLKDRLEALAAIAAIMASGVEIAGAIYPDPADAAPDDAEPATAEPATGRDSGTASPGAALDDDHVPVAPATDPYEALARGIAPQAMFEGEGEGEGEGEEIWAWERLDSAFRSTFTPAEARDLASRPPSDEHMKPLVKAAQHLLSAPHVWWDQSWTVEIRSAGEVVLVSEDGTTLYTAEIKSGDDD
jgi:hypothetical protein